MIDGDVAAASENAEGSIAAESLGSAEFREAHRLRYAYVAGAMYTGIATADLVIRMGRPGMRGFYGTGGMRPERIEEAILKIKGALDGGEPFGMNLICNLIDPQAEDAAV